ncbi:MAG: DUF6456 domain-containing protein [Beijerinckiaceae bacterium]
MSKSQQPRRRQAEGETSAGKEGLSRDATRLLSHLSGPDAFAAPGEFGAEGKLAVFAARKGVSLRVAGSTMDAADELVGRGLAHWQARRSAEKKYLTITEEGRSHRARETGPEGREFLAQHVILETTEVEMHGVRRQTLVDTTESPLAWLARRKDAHGRALIDPVQLEAGERFRRDLELAQMLPRVTANWSAAVASSGRGGTQQHITDTALAARQRAGNAIDAVGADCAGVLVDVCGFLKGLEAIEFERRWPRRSAKVVLAIALSALARHYGLAQHAKGPDSAGRLRHWGAEGFRPKIDGLASTGD